MTPLTEQRTQTGAVRVPVASQASPIRYPFSYLSLIIVTPTAAYSLADKPS